MKGALKASAAFFLLATSLGVLLRFAFVVPMPWLNFGNALHAHSHTLYFGWAALAVFALAFERVGARDAQVRWTLAAIGAVALASFVSFLQGGYSKPSIVISSLSLGIWAYAVPLFFRRAKGKTSFELAFLRTGFIYVAVAGTFALGRVALIVAHVDPLYGRLAVFGFLHSFAAFFVFAVTGLLIGFAEERGVTFKQRVLRRALGVWAPLAAFTFPLGVLGAEALTITRVASVVAVVVAVPQLVISRELLRGPRALKLLGGALGAKALMEAAGAFGLAALATQLRHPAILYLHVVLVGFVSGAIILLLRQHFGREAGVGFWAHEASLGVMCVGLLLACGSGVVATVGLWIAAVAGVGIVCAAMTWAGPLLVRRVAPARYRSAMRAELVRGA